MNAVVILPDNKATSLMKWYEIFSIIKIMKYLLLSILDDQQTFKFGSIPTKKSRRRKKKPKKVVLLSSDKEEGN